MEESRSGCPEKSPGHSTNTAKTTIWTDLRFYGRPSSTGGPLQKYLNAEKEDPKDLTSVVEAFLEMENLGIDYESFSSGDELADYLDGRRFPGFDEPIQITQLQREGLREIYAKRS